MRPLCSLLLVMCVLVSAVWAGPRKPPHREGPKDLSEEQHYSEGEEHDHNVQYDHEAFLGKEESEKFDHLSRKEARRRLGQIVDKIDKNSDGSVSPTELEEWIRHVGRRYNLKDADTRWEAYDQDKDGFISFDEYKDTMFGKQYEPDKIYDKRRGLTYQQGVDRYNRRFKAADKNGDKKLDREEFTDMLHPAEVKCMLTIYIDERMEDMDKDGNGQIVLEEYIRDLWWGEDGETEPDWVQQEREYFGKYRDRNQDGYLDKEELANMINPPGYDPAYSEAQHLFHEADENKDHLLSKQEILDHQDLFVGSRATNFGDAMDHDEF